MNDEGNEKRDYVFQTCLELLEEFKLKKKVIIKKLEQYEENNFEVKIFNSKNISIGFTEDKIKYMIRISPNLRKISFILLNGEKKNHWVFSITSLVFYLNLDKIKYPTFHHNNLDITLNEDNYNIFVNSDCKTIKENDKPDFNYKSLVEKFKEQSQNPKFSTTTFSNEKYFNDSFNQGEYDINIVETPNPIFALFEYIDEQQFKELKIIKNSKSCFSSIFYQQLKSTKYFIPDIRFLYIDLRFYKNNDFSSKEKTEVLLREAYYAVSNEEEYNELKQIILKFNSYSIMKPKLEKIINCLNKKERKIFLIFDHIDFNYSEELKNNLKLDSNNISIIKIFSLEETIIQKIFLEQVEKKPSERDYFLIMNYPQIKSLSKKYSILDKNPYYYGLKKTNKDLTFNQLYNSERTKIFEYLETFYHNNEKNLFCILSIKKLTESNDFQYSKFTHYFQNIPLDLFKIELYDNKSGIKKIDFKNYLIEYSIKNFIRKKFLSANIEPIIIDKMRAGNKGFLLEDLFDIFFISNKLPFRNIKSVSQLIVDQIFDDSKIIDENFSLIGKLNNENIFISQFNDNAKLFDSALILSLEDKKVLKIFQVTEGKKTKVLEDNYMNPNLKNNIDNSSQNLENLLEIKFDIIEFMFVLNYHTYEKKASNIINFCNNNNINYILFDYKKFKLYDKNQKIIKYLAVDINSIIIQRDEKKKEEKEEEKKEEENEKEEVMDESKKINISKIEDDDDDENENKSENKSDNSYNEIKSIVSQIEYSNDEINEEKNSIFFDKSKKDLELFKNKYKESNQITIIEKDNIKIGLSRNKDKNFLYKNISSIANNIKKEIRKIKFKYRILLLNQISIQKLLSIYILREKHFIYVKNKDNNYFIFKTNNSYEVVNGDKNYEIINLNKTNIILDSDNSTILVFKNHNKKNNSQILEKNENIKEKEYIGNKRSNSSIK